jgi:hypothetical protein
MANGWARTAALPIGRERSGGVRGGAAAKHGGVVARQMDIMSYESLPNEVSIMSSMKTRAGPDLISKKTRRELQEYFVGTTLRTIDDAFGDAGIDCNEEFQPTDSGARRCRVQKYYASLDFSKWDDVRKFLEVYAHVIWELEQNPNSYHSPRDMQRRVATSLKAFLLKDKFEYTDGRIAPNGAIPNAARLEEVATTADAPYLLQQIEHIENQIDADPRLAIGTSKELVETVCKTILRERNVEHDSKLELMDLVKLTRKELKLVPDDIPDSAKGADTIRKLLSNLASITQSLAELRNSYGTGHGHDGKAKGLAPRHARLAAGAASVLAKFLFETHQHHVDP